MTTLHDFDTLLQFASELAVTKAREERREITKRFNPNRYETHPQSMLLRKMAGAIEANGSWEATPAEIRQWIREDFDRAFDRLS